MKQQSGLSLVELMVSMVLGLILSAGAISLLITSQASYRSTAALSQVQQNANFALAYISEEFRKVGYSFGCPADTPTANSIYYDTAKGKGGTPYVWDISNGLVGYEIAGGDNAKTSEALPYGLLAEQFFAGTDLVSVQTLSQDENFIVQEHKPLSATITLGAAEHPYGNGDILGMVDRNCAQIGIFAVSVDNSNGATGSGKSNIIHNTGNITGFDYANCKKGLGGQYTCDNPDDAINRPYPPGSGIFRAVHYVFGIKPDTRNADLGVLHRINGATYQSEELVKGISNLQIEYGMGTGTSFRGLDNVTGYYTAAQINADASLDWVNVLSVNIKLTASSFDKVDGAYLQKDYDVIVTIRNRVVR